MRIFFDVDNTLLYSSGANWNLRPGTQEVMALLKEHGHDLYIWSATGLLHCQRLVRRYNLEPFVTACFDKDPACGVTPDIIVDDDWYLVEKYSGVCVAAYRRPDPEDRELFRILEVLETWNALKMSEDGS